MDHEDNIQLRMNFTGASGENRFRDQVYSAGFSLLFEIPSPSYDADLPSTITRYTPLKEFITSCRELPCSFAFTDYSTEYRSYPVIEFACALSGEDRDKHVIYLSGTEKDEERVAGFFAQCKLEGFRNVVCVSGMPSLKRKNGKVFESVKMLQYNRDSRDPLFSGAVVNPYKYEICSSLAQSFKLAKKARAGASFAVTQFGWDARKMQEVLWQMNRMGCNIPVFSRQMLLSPASAVEICSGNYPGVRFSRDFQNALRSEMQLSTAQFLAAQWRRFQLNAAGARLLGYSGIQIGGIESVAAAQTAYQMILDSFKEFTDYRDWLDAVNDYYSQMSVAPYPWRYYLFDNLLQNGISREEACCSKDAVPQPSAGEVFRYNLSKTLFSKSDKHPASERRLSKKLVVSCKGCNQCNLPKAQFICPESCPLGFRNGPCGEVDVSGKCFLSENECVHARRIRMSVFQQDYSFIDETVI